MSHVISAYDLAAPVKLINAAYALRCILAPMRVIDTILDLLRCIVAWAKEIGAQEVFVS